MSAPDLMAALEKSIAQAKDDRRRRLAAVPPAGGDIGPDPDPLGLWCLTCNRLVRMSEAEGNICDECLADRVEQFESERCAGCGAQVQSGAVPCQRCRDRDEANRPDDPTDRYRDTSGNEPPS